MVERELSFTNWSNYRERISNECKHTFLKPNTPPDRKTQTNVLGKTYLKIILLLIHLGDDHLILRGGGVLALLVGTDYSFSSRTRPENLFPGKSRTEYIQPQQIF